MSSMLPEDIESVLENLQKEAAEHAGKAKTNPFR